MCDLFTLTYIFVFFSCWPCSVWPLYFHLNPWSLFFSASEVVVCEYANMVLTCPNTEIVIESAVFGHYDHQYCGDSLSTSNCHQAGDFAIVDGLCTGEKICDVYVHPDTFGGDPCSGTTKYLHVHYRCTSEYLLLGCTRRMTSSYYKIYHPLFGIYNHVLIWGDWLSSDPLRGSHDSHISRVIGYHVTLSEGHMIANHPIKGNACAPSCGTKLFIPYKGW